MKRFFAFILLACFALAMGLILVSCGARKTNKSTSETVSTLERTVESKIQGSIQGEKMTYAQAVAIFNLNNTITDEAEILAPLYPDKPMVKTETIEGNTKTTTYQNAKVEKKNRLENTQKSSIEIRVDSTAEKSTDAIKIDTKINEKEKSESTTSDKTTEKESVPNWWLLLLLIPLLLSLCYVLRNRKS